MNPHGMNINKLRYSYSLKILIIFIFAFIATSTFVQAVTLEVKQNRNAIVKKYPTGNAEQYPDRLPPGTKVTKIGEVSRYYSIRLSNGIVGWSYKGNFKVVATEDVETPTSISKESLITRSDVLKIIVIDVEVGDSTLIICPKEEDGEQDVLLIDTGENDSDRIKAELIKHGFSLAAKPITRFYVTHYDYDHIGDAPELIPYAEQIYDHGDNNRKKKYRIAVEKPGVDRRLMTLNYQETFTGGVSVECVAVNQATDYNPEYSPSTSGDNPNSIALIITYRGFDYFTGGDLTHKA